MKSQILKRPITVAGVRTSVSLEEPFWNSVKEICRLRGITLSALADELAAGRTHSNLSSAFRTYVLEHYRSRALAAETPTQTLGMLPRDIPPSQECAGPAAV
jgi:predicted DNA-binding ribbon-helix-helix protein